MKWSSLARHSKSLHGIVTEVEVTNAGKRRVPKASCKMECDKCGKVFHTPHRMLGHLRIHLGLKVNARNLFNGNLYLINMFLVFFSHMHAMSVA